MANLPKRGGVQKGNQGQSGKPVGKSGGPGKSPVKTITRPKAK